MAFSYLNKKSKTSNQSNQLYITGFPLFSNSFQTKNLSKKESFYQYLYIRLISEKKLIKFDTDLEWKKSISKHPLKNFFSNPELIINNQRPSFLIEKINNGVSWWDSNRNKNSFQFSPKIFITYKKSFLSYWLLPLLGLMVSISPSFKSNFAQQKDFMSNYVENLTNQKEINDTVKTDNLLFWKKTDNHLNQKQKYNQYSKSLLLRTLNYYRKNGSESLLLKKDLESLFLDIDYGKVNFGILEKTTQNNSSFNWSWFKLDSDLYSQKDQNPDIVFPDKISGLTQLSKNIDLKDHSTDNLFLTNSVLKDALVQGVKINTNFFNLINEEKAFKVNPMLVDKNLYQSSIAPNYLVGVVNRNTFERGDKLNLGTCKKSTSPVDSINKSYFLIDQLSSNQPTLFHYLLSLSNSYNSINGHDFNLNSNREKALISIFKDKSTPINSSKKSDLNDINSDINNKKVIFSVNSDNLYDSVFNGLKDTLNFDSFTKSILLKDNKDNISLNFSKNLISSNLSKTKWSKLSSNKIISEAYFKSDNLFEFLLKNSLKDSSKPKTLISIKKNSISAGKFLPVKNKLNLTSSNSEKYAMIPDSLYKNKKIVKGIKKVSQVKEFSYKDNFLKNNQSNHFLTTSNYIDQLTSKIKNVLNPYKLRFSYLPEISLSDSKRLTEKNSKAPNFEKVFLSYLSKSKKSTYDFKSNVNHSNFLQSNLKLRTTQKLKTSNSTYLKLKASHKNKNVNFKTLNKNNSSLMILKNRLFLNKFGHERDLSEKNKNGSYSSSTIKTRQDLKVKRRLKKMKCETRRRKKRKIFYPRPNWVVFSLYKKFLGSRYSLNKSNSNSVGYLIKSNTNKKTNSSRQTYSHWLSNSRYSLDSGSYQKTIILKNSNDFYKISKTVLNDLRRVLMKSNWLRSYLNPYLEKVKTIYGELQKSSKKMDIYMNIQQFVGSIYGSPLTQSSNYYNTLSESSISGEIYLNLRNCLYELQNYPLLSKFTTLDNININQISNSSREQKINILEYNRIIYQRIQKSILNIRENLNLNGELKNRTKKLSKNIRPFIKRDYIKREMVNGVPTNQNSGFWSKVLKSDIIKFVRSFVSYQYDEISPYNNSSQLLSRNNFYWAVSKTSTFTNSSFNTSYTKKLWESSKIREISKSNKTKKIMFNLFMKYNNLFSPTASFEGFSHILDVFKNDPNFINSKEFENSRFTKFFYKKNVSSKDPILNYTNYSMDDEINKVTLKLSPNVYMIKTEQKLINIENKLKLLGLYSKKTEQNYKNTYFRFLKQELMKEKRFYYSNKSDKNHQNQVFNNLFTDLRYQSLNPITDRNFFNSNSSTLADKTKMANSYWWKPLSPDIDYLDQKYHSNIQKSSLINLSTFLFHFCALISFISLGGIRTLFKFYYILISKISKLIGSFEKIENLIPRNKLRNNFDSDGFIKIDDTFINKEFKNSQNEVMKLNAIKTLQPKQTKRLKLLGKNQPNKNSFDVMNNLKLSFLKYLILRKSKEDTFTLNFDDLKTSSLKTESYKLSSKVKNQVFVSKNQTFKKSDSDYLRLSNLKKFNFRIKNFNKLVLFIFNDLNKNQKKDTKFNLNSDLFTQNKLRLQYSSLVKASVLAQFMHKSSFYVYLILLRSVDILSVPASFIYKFFEKPGEYVVENLAYSFLVEWAADGSSTIPDIIDTNSALYSTKLNRVVSSIVIFNNNFMLNILSRLSNNYSIFNPNLLLQNIFFGAVSNSVVKRVLNSSFLVFIQQLCEPDLDYINRSKKAQSIWDIWGEHLKIIAEQNSINIYELTTDKQEQIKLLSKYEENLNSSKDTSQIKSNFLYNLKGIKNQSNLSPKLVNNKIIKTNSKQFINIISKKLKDSSSIQKVKLNPLSEFIYHRKKSGYNANAWSVNQFLSYQGKDSDLFIDLHPPKTFSSSSATLKYSFSAQQPIGSIVCQIFSGIFYKQVSKNILVVGSEGSEKSLLIQAIAGETEIKMITDSAHRYAMVNRGVAVGIKLLKDVFEALSMHTPCIFLLEDIHVIGERRPFLIDEGSSNSAESPYNKNQSAQGLLLKEKNSASREGLYKNNKHLLSHYKKPYKEIKGLATNHFCFTFLFGDIFSSNRPSDISNGSNLRTQVLKKQNQSNFNSTKSKLNEDFDFQTIYSSILEKEPSNTNLLSNSSPFNVLTLKESSKLKHKKTVKEMPWFGLPGEQFSLVSKYNYSIRVKVALLADLVLSNLSVKLDMITDLLVIIDSVKSNRGFTVFGTTHLPYILDPALRRPGRFDETISVPLIPGLYSRWANYQSNIQYLRSNLFNQYSIPFNYMLNKGISLDLTNYVSNSHQISMHKLINFVINTNKPSFSNSSNLTNVKNLNLKIKPGSKYLIPILRDKTFKTTFGQKVLNNNELNSNVVSSAKNYIDSLAHFNQKSSKLKAKNDHSKKRFNRSVIQLRSKNYSYACKSLILLFIYKHNQSEKNTNNSLKWPSLLKNSNNSIQDYSIYLSLFNSDKLMFRLILMSLIGVKVGDDFSSSFSLEQKFMNSNTYKVSNRVNGSFQFNFDKAWKHGSSILFNYIQKRQCSGLTKNVAFSASKLISFNNKYSLMEPPGPPISNVLLPSKRYENYKRTFNNQYSVSPNNFDGSISEKLQFHQQQRLLKRLYKYPIKQFFRSHLLTKNKDMSNLSSFNNSYLTLSPLEKMNFNSINKISSVNWSYRNILYNRHKTYLTNQWWTGLQGEHNAEATFLSDIDWRYTFIESIGDIQIDFPDAEQYYNPRNRRWILTKGDWNYWFNFESELKQIYSHYIYETFTTAYRYLDKNREMIDFYVDLLHQNSLPQNFNDRNLMNLYKRFNS